MSEQLSRLYRKALMHRRPAQGLDAEQWQALADGRLEGEALAAALDALAKEPHAPALLAFAEDAAQQSKLLALELRRADAVARSWSRPRRRLAWAAAAAVAALALIVPLSVKDGGDSGDTIAMQQRVTEVDRDVILASSFEHKRSSTETVPSESNGNGAIFYSRFDG
ncbi:MAG TPA: hypothetical protein PKZ76_08090 [Xanthomonadaceae bacterium]|nr:hypothetical protein [Xanthomonadaceae bacterium]